MKVTINKDGKTATDAADQVWAINELVIQLKEPEGAERRYKPTDHFFKVACPSGTPHTAKQISATVIDIF